MVKKYCNCCGKEYDYWDYNEDISIHRYVGYGSKYDGDEILINICCECFDKLVESCKIPPQMDCLA